MLEMFYPLLEKGIIAYAFSISNFALFVMRGMQKQVKTYTYER